MVVAKPSEFTKKWFAHLKWVSFMVCKLYLDKVVKINSGSEIKIKTNESLDTHYPGIATWKITMSTRKGRWQGAIEIKVLSGSGKDDEDYFGQQFLFQSSPLWHSCLSPSYWVGPCKIRLLLLGPTNNAPNLLHKFLSVQKLRASCRGLTTAAKAVRRKASRCPLTVGSRLKTLSFVLLFKRKMS